MAYQVGSFRGAKFYTRMAKTTLGRRGPIFELPYDEKGAAHIDLGRRARRYSIDAVLIGKDYADLTTKLMKALEKPGAGLLVHPYLGRVMVRMSPSDVMESTDEGGMTQWTLTAIEARDPLPPGSNALGLLDAAKAAKKSALESFVARLITDGPDFILQDAFDTLDSITDTLRDINNTITAVLETPGNLSAKLDAISRELNELLQTPRKLMDAIDNFLLSLMASAGRVFDTGTNADVLAPLGSKRVVLYSGEMADIGDGAPFIPGRTTAARTQQRENRAAILQSVRALVVANAAASLAELAPASRTESLEVGQTLADQIAQLADAPVEGIDMPADLYEALKDLAAAVHEYTDQAGGNRANVRVHRIAQAIPLEVLAYRFYGDAERAEELLARNPHVGHQGMVAANTLIEALDR